MKMEAVPLPEIAPPDSALADNSYMTLAREYLRERGSQNDEMSARPTLIKWRDEFYRWDGEYRFRRLERAKVIDELWTFLEGLKFYDYSSGKRRLVPVRPTPTLCKGVSEAAGALCRWEGERMPAWLDDDRARRRPDALDVVAFHNGVLDMQRFVEAGETLLIPPTPAWFSTCTVPYDYRPGAKCPLWINFLETVLGGKEASEALDLVQGEDDPAKREAIILAANKDLDSSQAAIKLLQEWFGYCMIGDTRHQKLMFLLGLPGSGKGTTIRVLTALLGVESCATPKLNELAGPFGLEALMDMNAALIADAHLGGRADRTDVLDSILAITGEDRVDVTRKYLPPLRGVRLGVRFTVGVNQIPSLPDSSNAMLRRMLVVQFRGSASSNADIHLTEKLLTELPGIACWALDGLRRLRTSGGFTVVEGSRNAVDMFRRSSAPIMAFLEDRCVIGPELKVECEALWLAWKKWAEDSGHEKGSKVKFGVNLHSAGQFSRVRTGSSGGRKWAYSRLALKAETSADDAEYDDEEGQSMFQ